MLSRTTTENSTVAAWCMSAAARVPTLIATHRSSDTAEEWPLPYSYTSSPDNSPPPVISLQPNSDECYRCYWLVDAEQHRQRRLTRHW